MRTLVTGMLSAAVLVVGISVAQAAPVGQLTGFAGNVAKASEQVNWRRNSWYPNYFFFHRHHRHHRFWR